MKSVRLVQIFRPVKETNRTHSRGYVEDLSTQRGRKRCAKMAVLNLSVLPYILLLRQCLCIELLARLGAHGHVVLGEGADPGTVGRVREDDVGGAEIRAGGVDGGIPCGAVHNLHPAREAARVVSHVGDDITVCHDPIKARLFAAHLPHLHKEDVLRTHGEDAVCTSKGRQSENTRSVVPFCR